MNKKAHGFTIVELLIVIVVIAILATISIVTYVGIQNRARDTQRKQDVASIARALEMYYVQYGEYPASSGCNSTVINSAWCTDADDSWAEFRSRLSGVATGIPSDPTAGSAVTGDPLGSGNRFSYSYYSYTESRCGAARGQWYVLYYKLTGGSTAQVQGGDDCGTENTLTSRPNVSRHVGIKR
jgi:prepilin-type N-terminal cleavage/methylation domain-containing protein